MMELNSAKKIVNIIKFILTYLILDLIHFECSALTGLNVDDIFTSISKHILNKLETGTIDPSSVIQNYSSLKPVILDEKEKTNMKNCNNC